MAVVREQKDLYSVRWICAALEVGRASYYRSRQPHQRGENRPIHPRALSGGERQSVLGVLNSERFWDQAPGEIYAALLDEGRYLCSESTLYRILAANQQVTERRDQLRHLRYERPDVIGTLPDDAGAWE